MIPGLPVAPDAVSLSQGAQAMPLSGDKTEKAARQFEGLLMSLLFQTMRRTVEPSGLLGDSGQSRSTFEYLMDQAVVERAVSTGHGWGLADRLKEAWNQDRGGRERPQGEKELPAD